MSNELEDWQLALLVEARRFNDPTLVEAEAAEEYRDHKDLIAQTEGLEAPVVVERSVKEQHEKAEALLDAASGIDDWEVVPADEREEELEALNDVKELLSDALKEKHGLRDEVVESMGASAMVNQFRSDDEGTIELESLAQQPETGGSPDDDPNPQPADSNADDGGDEEDPYEALSAADRKEVRSKLEKFERMKDRTPKFAESLRAEAAEIVGVEPDDSNLSLEVL